MSSSTSDRPITRQDVAGALMALSALPKRIAPSAAVEFAAFEVALEGVIAGDLATGVKAILQGARGHAFFPSPPELRIQCDEARDARLTVLEEVRRRKAIRDEAAAFAPIKHDPAEVERVARLYREFCAWDDRERRRVMSADEELEAIKAKYSPIALAQIPDRQPPRGMGEQPGSKTGQQP